MIDPCLYVPTTLHENPHLSPDGRYASYEQAVYSPVLSRTLHVIELVSGADKVIELGEVYPYESMWLADSRTMLVKCDAGTEIQWTEVDVVSGTTNSIQSKWSLKIPLRVLATSSEFPRIILVENGHPPEILQLDLDSSRTPLGETSDKEGGTCIVDDDLRIRAHIELNGDEGIVKVARDESGGFEEAFRLPRDFQIFRWISAEGTGSRLWMLNARDTNTKALCAWDVNDRTLRTVYHDPNYDIVEVLIDPTTRAVDAVRIDRPKPEWVVINPAITEALTCLASSIPGFMTRIERSTDGCTWLVETTSDVDEWGIWSFSALTKHARLLAADLNPNAERNRFPMEPLRFTARDGLGIEAFFTRPANGNSPFQTVLVVHGGPHSRDECEYHPWVHTLAANGYACLQVNFRGSTGRGTAFRKAGVHEWGGRMQDDLTDAVEWAVNSGLTDGKRLAIMGGSYGGYAALACAAFTSNLFKAAIALDGIPDLVAWGRQVQKLYPELRYSWSATIGDYPWNLDITDEEYETNATIVKLRQRSPATHVDQVRIPILVAYSEYDDNAIENRLFAEQLEYRGGGHENLYFFNELHCLHNPHNQIKFLRSVVEFLKKNV